MSVVVTLGAGMTAAVAVARARARESAERAHALRPAPTRARPRSWAVPAAARSLVAGVMRARVQRRSDAALRRELPVVAELFRMAVAAGLTPTQAVRMAAPLAPPVAGAALADAVRAVDLGAGLEPALHRLRASSPALAGLADALGASSDLGLAVEDALARLGHEARATLRRAAEARARAVPVRLLFPLVLCVLPAFALLGVAPSIIAGLAG